jgi:hypothetical protein
VAERAHRPRPDRFRRLNSNWRVMTKHLALLICVVANQVSAASWRPPDRLLHAVRYVESSHGLFTYGDNGQSLGDFQLSEAAWLDVSCWRKTRDMPTYSYDRHVWNRAVNRAYAADYLAILHRELSKRLARPPTSAEVYAAYNMGLSSFAQCNYQLAKVNPTTARKCQTIRAIMAAR